MTEKAPVKEKKAVVAEKKAPPVVENTPKVAAAKRKATAAVTETKDTKKAKPSVSMETAKAKTPSKRATRVTK